MTADERVETLRVYGGVLGLRTFVETGTADGATTLALKNDFDRLITIELDYERYLHVLTSDFVPYPQILPIWGDSGKVLVELVHWLTEPALYWLDAHYCGGVSGDEDTPIRTELLAIGKSAREGSLIVVDDAHLFGIDPAYPTLGWMQQWADGHGYSMALNDDLIELHRQ